MASARSLSEDPFSLMRLSEAIDVQRRLVAYLEDQVLILKASQHMNRAADDTYYPGQCRSAIPKHWDL